MITYRTLSRHLRVGNVYMKYRNFNIGGIVMGIKTRYSSIHVRIKIMDREFWHKVTDFDRFYNDRRYL